MPKRVTSRRAYLLVFASGQHNFRKKNRRSGDEPLATLTMIYFTGPRFEPVFFRSRNERVSARPTLYNISFNLLLLRVERNNLRSKKKKCYH